MARVMKTNWHWIYAIGAMKDECEAVAIKFGITSGDGAIAKRLKSLQTGSYLPLDVLGIRRRETRDSAVRMEAWLHGVLAGHRLTGEWFVASPVVERVVRRSFYDNFTPNWYDRHCWPIHGERYESDEDFECDCRAPEWRCA